MYAPYSQTFHIVLYSEKLNSILLLPDWLGVQQNFFVHLTLRGLALWPALLQEMKWFIESIIDMYWFFDMTL